MLGRGKDSFDPRAAGLSQDIMTDFGRVMSGLNAQVRPVVYF